MNEKVEEPQEQVPEHVPIPPEKLQEILEAHRKWVESEGKKGEIARLYEANLQKAYLRGANLQGAKLFGANLQGAKLFGANLQGAYLRGANLQGAKLFGANLQGAYLSGANLQGADLHWANLSRARMIQANLRGADLRNAINLTAPQVKRAKNWELALYSDDFLKKLGLKPDHNERVENWLAEMEKEKKATDVKQ